MKNITFRYAIRSLTRHRIRTLLSVFAITFGVGIGLLALSWVRGEETMSTRMAADGGMGHLRLAPAGWNFSRDEDARLVDSEAALASLRGASEVRLATPRVRLGGLLGMGTRSSHVTLTGVDPEFEPDALLYLQGLNEGRYLEAGEMGSVVLGQATVRRLNAQLEDELVLTVVDSNGDMQSALLTIVGIVETGNRDIDATIAHISLAEAMRLSGSAEYSEVTVLLHDVSGREARREALTALAPLSLCVAAASETPSGCNELLRWEQVAPELGANVENDTKFMNFAIFLILMVVLFGVASAQLTAVLERRKEFAVLAALGMGRGQLMRLVVIEGFLLGFSGALGSLLVAGPFVHWLSVNGVDMTAFVGEEGVAFGGILFNPIFYPEFGAWLVPTAFSLALFATITASLYPAFYAAQTNAANALRVDR